MQIFQIKQYPLFRIFSSLRIVLEALKDLFDLDDFFCEANSLKEALARRNHANYSKSNKLFEIRKDFFCEAKALKRPSR
jgi:hypothetical protein